MTLANSLHTEAMDYAGRAFIARMRGHQQEALGLFEEALVKEKAAIDALEDRERIEPWYSVLHRSAAWLALDCDRPLEAEKLAAKALAGDPYPEIADELREVWQQAIFNRHLAARGVELSADEIQMSLAGEEVAPGFANQHEVVTRLRDSLRMMQRISERQNGHPFKESNYSPKGSYRLYTSLPRAASYALTLRLAVSPDQLSLPGMQGPDAVLDEFVELIGLLDSSQTDELQERISDPSYFRNFIALGRQIAPDGERIKMVGFTKIRQGVEQSVALTRRTADIPRIFHEHDRDAADEPREIVGQLRYADATGTNKIILISDEKKSPTIIVPEGMMDDIVRPMWGSYVRIAGIRKGKQLILENITLAEPPA